MKRVRVWLRVAVGLGLLLLIVSRADARDLSVTVGPRLVLGMVGAVGLFAVAQGLAAWRWRVILGPTAPSWRYLFRLYLIGLFFSLFLPTSIGGDTVRATAASAQRPDDAGRVVASVVLDRVVGVVALLFYCVLGIGLDGGAFRRLVGLVQWRVPTSRVLALAVLAAAAGIVAMVLLVRRFARARSLVSQARGVTVEFLKSPSAVMRAAGLGLAVQAAYILVWAGLAQGLAWNLSLGFLLFAVPFVSLCAMAPVTLAGMGVREGAWLLLLAPLGISTPNAVAYGLLYFLCMMVVAGAGGLLFSVRGVTA